MIVQMFCLFLVCIMKAFPSVAVPFSTPQCDFSRDTVAREGPLGETGTFPWLGILRVHRHDQGTLKVALTGIVLVKNGYAIGFADDLVRIPKKILQRDSKAMFIPNDEEPWYCNVKDYMTHPEYEYSTMSTIALLELEPGDGNLFPMMPICWSSYAFNATNQLYAVGYTDENRLLEKTFYKMVYVEESLCNEFYSRAGMTKDKMAEPTHVQCGFAANNNKNCVWDNGMALISNASSKLTLIGIGLHGPGCAAPARFIDMLHYYDWIEAASDLQEIDDLDARKSYEGGNLTPEIGDNKTEDPLNGFHQDNKSNRSSEVLTDVRAEVSPPRKHTFVHYYPHPFNITTVTSHRQFIIQRENATSISLYRNFSGQIGNCSLPTNVFLYKDEIKVVTIAPAKSNAKGTARYKISTNDLNAFNYSCVKIKVHSQRPNNTYLNYSTELTTYGDPVNLIKHLLQLPPSWLNTTKPPDFIDKLLKKNANKENAHIRTELDILLEITFVNEATLEIIFYGNKTSRKSNNKKPISRRNSLRKKTKDTEVINTTTENVNFKNHSLSLIELFVRDKILSWNRLMLETKTMMMTKSYRDKWQSSGREFNSKSRIETTTALTFKSSNGETKTVSIKNDTVEANVTTTEGQHKSTDKVILSEKGKLAPKSLARYNLHKNGPITDEHVIVINCSERNSVYSYMCVVMQLFLILLYDKIF